MNNIPFLDLQRLHRSIDDEVQAAIRSTIDRGAFVGKAAIAGFEERFGAAHASGPGAGCGSGTDALTLALKALGISAGDEVIVPAMTFIATAEAVVHAGGTPVVADVDPITLLLTPDTVDAVRTPRTRAVMPVHLYGHIVPAAHLRHWREEGLLVVEDAAQAHLGRTEQTPVGTIGHAACFSFYPGKNLGAFGDGGMVISADPNVVEEVQRIRDHGRVTKYTHDVVGHCSRLDGIQAAILDVKLNHLEAWTHARVTAAERYRSIIGDRLVPWNDGAVHHLLVARFADRDAVQERLGEQKVATGIHYPVPLSQQPWLATDSIACPNAEQAAAEILSLPMDPLMTLDEVDEVAARLDRVLSPA